MENWGLTLFISSVGRVGQSGRLSLFAGQEGRSHSQAEAGQAWAKKDPTQEDMQPITPKLM